MSTGYKITEKEGIFFILFTVFMFSQCNTHEEYVLYNANKYFNYPNEKLKIVFINDTTGIFLNNYNINDTFNQQFNYVKTTNFLKIKNINIENPNVISLKKGDTIIYHKNKLYYFYNGEKKYGLYFKKRFLK